MMRIAYIGQTHGTSLHRANALRRLGHEVTVIDPWSWLGKSKWSARWQWHAAGVGIGLLINRRCVSAVRSAHPELIFVDQGEFLGPQLIRDLRKIATPVVNYAIDDPFGLNGRKRFMSYRRALPEYNLAVVVRSCNIQEAQSAGARRVMHVWRSADEIAHKPPNDLTKLGAQFASEVVFVGTWMPERGAFMAQLIKQKVPLSIWGDRWQKAPEWPAIRSHWRGVGLTSDTDYAAAIASSRIALGLLSKGNRDLHTTRSLEIPAIGALFCGERTSEHQELYVEGEEAVFWKDAQECASLCRQLLADEPRRAAIARRGHERALRNGHFNEPVLAAILEEAFRK